MTKKTPCLLLACLLLLLATAGPLEAASPCPLFKSQSVFLPLVEYVYLGRRNTPYFLDNKVVIHNADPEQPVTITRLTRHDSQGKRVAVLLKDPLTLAPLASWHLLLPQREAKSGPTGSVLLSWKSAKPASPPQVQCIIVGSAGQQGISFINQGQVVRAAGR